MQKQIDKLELKIRQLILSKEIYDFEPRVLVDPEHFNNIKECRERLFEERLLRTKPRVDKTEKLIEEILNISPDIWSRQMYVSVDELNNILRKYMK